MKVCQYSDQCFTEGHPRDCANFCIGWWKAKCERIQKSALKRNMAFNLTPEYMSALFEKQGGFCALSGMKLQYGEAQGTSVDRIMHDLGYVQGNVRITTWQVNQARGRWSDAELFAMCKNVMRVMNQGFNGYCDVDGDGTHVPRDLT